MGNGQPAHCLSINLYSYNCNDYVVTFLYYLDAYQAEKTPLLKERRPPAFSFGLRTKTSIKDDNPSPNAYLLPALLGTNVVGKSSNPAYSMTGRSKNGSFDEDLQKVSCNINAQHIMYCCILDPWTG